MKKIFILILLRVALSMPGETRAETTFEAGFGVFHSSLSPYGEWVNVQFGEAWRPLHLAHGWRPYSYGKWAWTDYGWYWVSEEPFGWATFHYGRWYFDDFYGWVWIPGETWGPAWVEWRNSDNYIGWAPLPPYAEFHTDVGIRFTNHWVAPLHYWNFVPCEHFASARAVDYIQPAERARRFFGSTRTTLNIQMEGGHIINRGIEVGFVERRGNVHVNRVDVVINERGSGERFVREADHERIEAYRPKVEPRVGDNAIRTPVPARAPRRIEGRQAIPVPERSRVAVPPPRQRLQPRRANQPPVRSGAQPRNAARQRAPQKAKPRPPDNRAPDKQQ